MEQVQLDEQKTSILILMVILGLSSLGFAVLGLVLGSDLVWNLDLQPEIELEITRLPVPDLENQEEFWLDRGYTIVSRDEYYELVGVEDHDNWCWVQGREKLVLVPESSDHRLATVILELGGLFLEGGWSIQLDRSESGYVVGFWSTLPEDGRRVLAYDWQIELLNPHNYDYVCSGLISVMGEPFDPRGFLRGTTEAPVLAIIIDDWGYSTAAVEPMVAYPLPLTMAILPHLELSSQVSERLHAAGHEVILHQPMEALNSSLDLGPGGIVLSMGADEIEDLLLENLKSVPAAVGMNNHMGSLITSDDAAMTAILEIVRDLGLFFVDSRTSAASVVAEIANRVGVAYGVNNFFLDNENDLEKIKEQIRSALELAKKQGHAVVIGHVRPVTATALWEMIPEFLDSEVQLVPISRLLYNQ